MISRKSSFLIILILASLLIGGLIGFYFYSKSKNAPAPFLGRTSGHVNFGSNPNVASGNSSAGQLLAGSTTKDSIIPRLREISATPTAGANFVLRDIFATSSINVEPPDLSTITKPVATPKPKAVSTNEVIRFMERGTGNIFETSTSTVQNTRISNTTIPTVYEAYFLNKGDSVILRDLIGDTDIIRTRLGTLNYASPSDSEESLTLSDLPLNIAQMAVSPSKSRIFSLFNSGVTGIMSSVDGGSKVGMFSSAFTEWLAFWPTEQNIILTTKASGFAPGYVYSLDTKTKDFTRLFGGENGLTVLPSNDASRFLFSESGAGSFKLKLYTRKDSSIKDLNLSTFPEKCVWSRTDNSIVYCGAPENISFDTYPDVWYQGLITFSDSIWKINVDTGEMEILEVPQNDSGQVIDVINPSIDSTDDYLIFMNKVDLSLWGLRLEDPVVTQNAPAASVSTSTSAQ